MRLVCLITRRVASSAPKPGFHAIYPLDQDSLLELHYDLSLEDSRQPRWNAHCTTALNPSSLRADLVDQKRRVIGPPVRHDPLCQPIYKLHGSVDWIDATGGFLVIGGGKESMIEGKPLLVEYFQHFRHRLRQPDARLMIISFKEHYIKDRLGEAWADNRSLSAFYVDRHGRKVIRGITAKEPVLPRFIPQWGYMKCVGKSQREPCPRSSLGAIARANRESSSSF